MTNNVEQFDPNEEVVVDAIFEEETTRTAVELPPGENIEHKDQADYKPSGIRMDTTYQIVTNLSCNLDCEYCYERKFPRNNKLEDCVDFVHACFDRDRNNPEAGGVIIDVIGGEPFLQPKLLIAIFETAEELCKRDNRPFIFSISTNGTLFRKKINQEIIKRWHRNISVGVSVDGLPETHDKYRIYTSTGKGSYDDAVWGYNWLKTQNLRELGIKATFTNETLPHYAASMKNLIDISGGGTINGNVTYEDIIPRGQALFIATQMIEVIEYWIEKGLHKNSRNTLGQVIPSGLNIDGIWDPDNRDAIKFDETVRLHPERVRPFCGTIKYMTCLGFDRKVYGCNRFMSTVTTRQAIAKLDGRTIVNIDDNRLANEVQNQIQDFSDHCLTCPAKHTCGSCAAAPYENKDGSQEARKEYHAERRQCGWTMAKLLVGQWWAERFGDYNDQYQNKGCSGCCGCSSNDEQKG